MRLKEAEQPHRGCLSNSEVATSTRGAPASKVGDRILHAGDERGGEGGNEVQRALTALQRALKLPSLSELNKTNLHFFCSISFKILKIFFSMNKEKEPRLPSKVGMWGEGNRAKRRGSQDRAHPENLSSTHCKHYRFSWSWELWTVLMMSSAAGSDKWHFSALWISNAWQEHLDNTHMLKPKHVLKCFADQGSEKLCLWFF